MRPRSLVMMAIVVTFAAGFFWGRVDQRPPCLTSIADGAIWVSEECGQDGSDTPARTASAVPRAMLDRPGSGEPDDGPLVDEDLLAKGRAMTKADAGSVIAAMGL